MLTAVSLRRPPLAHEMGPPTLARSRADAALATMAQPTAAWPTVGSALWGEGEGATTLRLPSLQHKVGAEGSVPDVGHLPILDVEWFVTTLLAQLGSLPRAPPWALPLTRRAGIRALPAPKRSLGQSRATIEEDPPLTVGRPVRHARMDAAAAAKRALSEPLATRRVRRRPMESASKLLF